MFLVNIAANYFNKVITVITIDTTVTIIEANVINFSSFKAFVVFFTVFKEITSYVWEVVFFASHTIKGDFNIYIGILYHNKRVHSFILNSF